MSAHSDPEHDSRVLRFDQIRAALREAEMLSSPLSLAGSYVREARMLVELLRAQVLP